MIEVSTLSQRYELVRTDDGGERMYATPVENVPLDTTVLSGTRDNSGLEAWLELVSEACADFISSLASHRGTVRHTYIKNYLRDSIAPGFSFLTHALLVQHGSVYPRHSPSSRHGKRHLKPQGQEFCRYVRLHRPPPQGRRSTVAAGLENRRQTAHTGLYLWYSLQAAAYVAATNHVYVRHRLAIKTAKVAVTLPD